MEQLNGIQRIIQVIKEAMARDNLSERDLAQRSGLDHSSINRMLRGETVPSLDSLIKIANALGYSWVSFLALLRGTHADFQNSEYGELFSRLSPEDREDVIAWMRLRARRHQQGRA